MKILRTALILAVAMVITKILHDTSWHSSEFFHRYRVQQTDTSRRYLDTQLSGVTTSVEAHKDNNSSVTVFRLLQSKELKTLFAKNEPSLRWDVTLRQHDSRIDATLYHLPKKTLFPLAAQSIAFYGCTRWVTAQQPSLKLYVRHAVDNESQTYLLDRTFCSDVDLHFPLLAKATETQSFELKFLSKPPLYKRLQPLHTIKLYDNNQTGPSTVGLMKQAAVNDTYFVYLDDEGQLAYLNRKTNQIDLVPDFLRDFIPTAIALDGHRLYIVENYLYAYDLQTHRVSQASEAIGWGDRIVVKGDRIYVLKKEDGWYLFVYDKTLHLHDALHTQSEFEDIKIGNNGDMVAYDFKHWYRFDGHTGNQTAQVSNTNLIVAVSSTQVIDNNATVYDRDFNPIRVLKPLIPIVDAIWLDDKLLVQNLDLLAVYDTKNYRRRATVPNKGEYIAADGNGKTYATIVQKGIRYRIDFYDTSLQTNGHINLTFQPGNVLAASSSYAAFSIGNRLIVIDTANLQVLRFFTIAQEPLLFDVNGTSIYLRDALDRMLRFDPKADEVTSLLSSTSKDDFSMITRMVVSKHLMATYAILTSDMRIFDLSNQTSRHTYHGVDKLFKLSDHTIAFVKGNRVYDSLGKALASLYPYDRNKHGDTAGITVDDELWIQPAGSQHRYGYWVGFMFDPKVVVTKHYVVISDAHAIYRISLQKPQDVVRIDAIARWDELVDIRTLQNDTILILSKNNVTALDLAKPSIIKHRQISDIVTSIKE